MRSQGKRQRAILALLVVAGLGMSTAAFADEDVRGVITARGRDGTIMLRTDDASSLIVVLDDKTRVKRTDGLREVKISSALLMPGLRVEVEGFYLDPNRLAATRVKFSRSDLRTALAIAANSDHLRANDDKIGRAGLAIEAANMRLASLADHEVKSTMTVYFKNGSAVIGRKQAEKLERVADQAKALRGFVIQVEGHASAVGPEALNQHLSLMRAQAVAAVLSQNGIPPTHMLVPATMGVSAQVAANTTSKGQSENRRVVVTLLQNKGINDSSAANPGSTTVERANR